MAEIMFKFNNYQTRKTFKKIEMSIFIGYIVFIASVNFLKVWGVYLELVGIEKDKKFELVNDPPIFLAEIIPLVNMIVIFLILSY